MTRWIVWVMNYLASLPPLIVLNVGQGTCCCGRWWHGEDRPGTGTIAGALAALSMYFYSAPSLALYMMWKVVEVSCCEIVFMTLQSLCQWTLYEAVANIQIEVNTVFTHFKLPFLLRNQCFLPYMSVNKRKSLWKI